MANYSGQNFTTLTGLNAKGSIVLRMPMDGGFEGTLAIKESADQSFAYKFPHKSGTFPIMGTFNVQFPTNTSSSNVFSTIVTVPGIRAEDALVVFLNSGVTASYDVFAVGSGMTARILYAAKPGNGNITLGFMNNGLTTVYTDLIYSYLAMR